jgi:hypothetical protein
LSLFFYIIDPNESEPFIEICTDEVAWLTNGFAPFNQCHHKYFLTFLPKEYESRFFIRTEFRLNSNRVYKICETLR